MTSAAGPSAEGAPAAVNSVKPKLNYAAMMQKILAEDDDEPAKSTGKPKPKAKKESKKMSSVKDVAAAASKRQPGSPNKVDKLRSEVAAASKSDEAGSGVTPALAEASEAAIGNMGAIIEPASEAAAAPAASAPPPEAATAPAPEAAAAPAPAAAAAPKASEAAAPAPETPAPETPAPETTYVTPEALPDVSHMSIKELKEFITKEGLSHADCMNKEQLRVRAAEALAVLTKSDVDAPAAPAAAEASAPENDETACASGKAAAEDKARSAQAAAPKAPAVYVRYNHRNDSFEAAEGRLDFSLVDAAYCLSYVLKGEWACKLKHKELGEFQLDGGRLRMGKDESGDPIAHGTFSGLRLHDDDGKGGKRAAQYVLYVQQDESVASLPRQGYKGSSSASSSGMWREGSRKEGCSCLFGNPCATAENCLDWHHRFEVAKRNSGKGFPSVEL